MALGNYQHKILGIISQKINQLTPQRIVSKFNGVKILINGIPKGGTHLVIRCLSLIPMLSYTGIHITKGNLTTAELQNILNKNCQGRFTAVHLWWSKEAAQLLNTFNFKTILILRDPRDIVVSKACFIPTSKKHHLNDYFRSLPDLDARITACIVGVDACYSKKERELLNIREVFVLYTPWIKDPNNLTIKFEDLIGSKGGGNDKIQRHTILKIATHLQLTLTGKEIDEICNKSYYKKSVTFRRGQIGDWKNHFNYSHKKAFKEIAGQTLIDLGYEKSFDW